MADVPGTGSNGKVLFVTELAARLDAILDQLEALAGGSYGAFDYCEVFVPVEDQLDYLWGTGSQQEGEIDSDARTEARNAMVQWGVAMLAPLLDYTILEDRLRLATGKAPTAEQVAAGEPLVVRVKRSAT